MNNYVKMITSDLAMKRPQDASANLLRYLAILSRCMKTYK